MIHVAVISPIRVVRSGLKAMLGDDSLRFLVSEAVELSELENRSDEIDVWLAASDSVPADFGQRLANLPAGRPAVLILTDQVLPISILSGLKGRAWGILSLDSSAEELQAAVLALHQGLLVGSPELAGKDFQRFFAGSDAQGEAPVESLTQRETEVLGLLALGLANKQIAVRLGISEHTVKFHISAIYAKLGTTNRTEAVRVGVQQGLISI